MGEAENAPLKLNFDPKVRLEFRGATITSDAGLLACRELDDALGLTNAADEYLHESRTGENIRHKLVRLLRQSVYSRLAGYDDTNDADRLSQDPAIRVVVGWKGSDSNAASTSEMGRFETEWLTQEKNLKGLSLLNTRWVRQAMAHTVNRRVILDIDGSESPVYGKQEGSAYNGAGRRSVANSSRRATAILALRSFFFCSGVGISHLYQNSIRMSSFDTLIMR